MKSVYAPHVPSFRNEENPKTLMKDIKEDLHKWRDIPCSWIGRQYCQDVSSSQFHQQINPSQNPSKFFVDINKLFLKFVHGGKRPREANTILKEKNKAGRLML